MASQHQPQFQSSWFPNQNFNNYQQASSTASGATSSVSSPIISGMHMMMSSSAGTPTLGAAGGLGDGHGTPSLGRSDDSAADPASGPHTPSDRSPFLFGDAYNIPQSLNGSDGVPALALPPHRAGTPQPSALMHAAVLPEILDPATAANVPIRHVCCIGAGYVGGPTAAVVALHNPHVRVTVVDRDESRIAAWKGKHLPIHEPGLTEVVRLARDGCQDGRLPNLFFSTACTQTIAEADMILVSVNTPTKRRGVGAGRATDMTALEGAVRDIAMHARPGTILVEKSTVPCKTGQLIKDIMEAHRPGIVFPVLSNPEFLSEGTAVRDLMQPDRVVIGCESTISGHRAAAALANLYAAWVPRHRIAPINIWSSELCKLAANAMLAQRISSINSISAICERTGADVTEIAKSVGMDPRIGPQFLKSGIGFGGSCFRKDIASLTYLAESLGLPEVAAYWQQVLTMNDFQRDRFARHVIATLNNSLRGKKITILGYAFKKNTGDARESPALDVIRLLLEEGPRRISIYDPLCSAADIARELAVLEVDHGSLSGGGVVQPHGPVEILSDPYAACEDSSAVLILTGWDMFLNTPSPGTVASAPRKVVEMPLSLDGSVPSEVIAVPASHLAQQQIQAPASKHTAATKPVLPAETLAQLHPEPACATSCADCATTSASGPAQSQSEQMDAVIKARIDWSAISRTVREPRWVFDGVGIVDARAMIGHGFRLETLGRASIY